MPSTAIAKALGGRPCGRGFIVRCVAHDDRSPSLSLADGEDGRLLVHCHAGCDARDVLHALRQRGLLEGTGRPARGVARTAGHAARTAAAMPPSERIAAIVRRSRPIAGTLAETYLRGRGLDPGLADPEALRFLPAIGERLPAMMAVVTDFADASRVLGLQFTPLRPGGTRGERTFLRGSKPGGGVVRLVDDAEVTLQLGLAEGVETALAVATAMRRDGRMVLPIWSALGAGNLARLPVLPAPERLFIFADRDGSGVGQRAAEGLARRWREAGREARVALPGTGDWNTP